MGNRPLIIYKSEMVEDGDKEFKYGIYRYAITDGTSVGWELRTFQKFHVGDTLKISIK